MNILPKKRWHVRTWDNIVRVRKDEAKAAEEEKQKEARAALADQEHRTRLLRQKAATARGFDLVPSTSSSDQPATADDDGATPSAAGMFTETGHVNLFRELESEEKKNMGQTNKEYEKEKKEMQEAEEKKIGLLRYLGEGSAEYAKDLPWYQQVPKRDKAPDPYVSPTAHLPSFVRRARFIGFDQPPPPAPVKVEEKVAKKRKKEIKREKKKKSKKSKEKSEESKEKEKSKKSKKSKRRESSSSEEGERAVSSTTSAAPAQPSASLDRLRAERLQREAIERRRAELLMRKRRGEPEEEVKKEEPRFTQKYSSQFNPEMARQNQKR